MKAFSAAFADDFDTTLEDSWYSTKSLDYYNNHHNDMTTKNQ